MFCSKNKKKVAQKEAARAELVAQREAARKKKQAPAPAGPAEDAPPAAEPKAAVAPSKTEAATPAAKPTHDDFVKILDKYWDAYVKSSPMGATQMGYHDDDDKLDEVSVEAYESWRDQCEAFLNKLEETFPEDDAGRFEGWNLNGKTTFLVLVDTLKSNIRMVESKTYLVQMCTLSAPQIDLPQVLEKNKFEDVNDLKNFKKRLEAIPRYIKQHCDLLELGLEQNITQSRVVLANIPSQIEAMLSADKNPYGNLLEENWKKTGASAELRDEVAAVIDDKVLPAFKEFAEFMEEFCPKLSEETAMPKRMANGEEMYKFLVGYHTTTDMTPQEVHEVGLKEVARITDTMREIAEKEGFTGEDGIDEYQASIDERCVCKTEEELLDYYRAVAMNIMPQLPKLFGTLPRTPYGIRPIPAFAAPHAPGAYYEPPPADLSTPGWFALNTYELESRKTYIAEALVAHEAVPGHHMQIALATENQDLPIFRKYTYHTAYVEGWGLYSECLGFELGLYKTSESHFGRLQIEILRACRLVVDTGMNYMGWTRQQSIDFMLKHRAGTLQDCESESSRYLGLPGQALAYKIGEIKLRELRSYAEKELGKKFDIRAFHDLLIAVGSVPLSSLELIVNDWVAERK